jgi:hypothetical protein
MNQGNILEKMVDAGITNETFSAEDVMERMMKKKEYGAADWQKFCYL